MEESLLVSKVPRALEMKSKLFGFELPDLLLIFLNLALTNLIFGATSYRYPLVWGSTATIALFVFFVKRGKPDNYIQHMGEYLARPSYYSAASIDRKYRTYKSKELHVNT